jgi:hypothetical protein
MTTTKEVKVPKEKKLTDIQFSKIDMVLKMFKCLLPLYIEYKNNESQCVTFCGLNRSVIYDITSCSFFKVGLISDEALKKMEKNVEEHVYNRTLSSRVIFSKLEKNPNMTIEEFIEILKKYGTTITLTESEHNRLPKGTKGFYEKSYEDYVNIGANIPGFKDHMYYLKSID